MQKSILIFALAVMGATQVHAAQPNDNGFYFGGVVGYTGFDDDGLGDVYGEQLSKSAGAFGVFGGYKLLRFLAVEGRFTYLGDAGEALRYKTTALTANVVGILPLGSSGIELFGQVGLGGLLINENLSNAGIDSQDNEPVATAGVGIRAYATETVAFSLQYDMYGWEQEDKGQTYDFSSDSVLVGMQWQF